MLAALDVRLKAGIIDTIIASVIASAINRFIKIPPKRYLQIII
jgi:hypothetical protein